MAEPFIATIVAFGGNFAPRGWAFCNGQILAISQNTALFSILGTTYGGNGQTTFALPDLRGRVPVHQGQGPGLSSYSLGQAAGAESTTLTLNQIPQHGHPVGASSSDAASKNPSGRFPAVTETPVYGDSSNASMNAAMVGQAGASQPHDNIQPYLALSFIIALEGIFPSRN
jgi:microcystin-dependent protein